MRAVVQRVSEARVRVGGRVAGEIARGLVVFAGVAADDGPADVRYLASKIPVMRIFEGDGGKVPFGFSAFERATEMIPAARRASLAALRQLAASYRDLDVFCAHDEREYAALATSRRS